MRLIVCHDSAGQRIACAKCGKKLALEGAIADLDGPAFRAYYHLACAPGTLDDHAEMREADTVAQSRPHPDVACATCRTIARRHVLATHGPHAVVVCGTGRTLGCNGDAGDVRGTARVLRGA